MSKLNIPNSLFTLEETKGLVNASLQDEHDYSLQYTIDSMPHPRVRVPRRSKKQIEEDSISMASAHHDSQSEFLTKNILGTKQQISEHVQEIRKTLKRIQGLTHYVVTAQEVLDEIPKNT